MKEKLEVIREALESSVVIIEAHVRPRIACNLNKEALALLDTLIAELDSAELVEKVAGAIEKYNPFDPYETNQYDLAKAAINTIKGIITATRDRE